MMKRLFSMAFCVLAACSTSDGEPTGLQTAISVLDRTDDSVTPRFQALATTPRPIMQIGLIDAGTAGNMVLEARDGDFEHYLSPNAASMTFNRGMLHRMTGFGEALMATEVSGPLRLILSGQSGTADRIHSYLGGDDKIDFRTYRCVITSRGSDTVTLPNRSASATLMHESCRNTDHTFENLYWVEQGRGQIIQSRQWAGPNLGAVSTRRAGLPSQ